MTEDGGIMDEIEAMKEYFKRQIRITVEIRRRKYKEKYNKIGQAYWDGALRSTADAYKKIIKVTREVKEMKQ